MSLQAYLCIAGNYSKSLERRGFPAGGRVSPLSRCLLIKEAFGNVCKGRLNMKLHAPYATINR
ncbi:hypothetical protein NEISICOT_02950 [Neisseria sicca ATCC 29256]|uniref:Uncharacterized protein n=1 Tax=Neisseria sicca ATCC 29256 TaxID=547045 RepID=C6M8S5_NEISI|nr:hypothetical protein NEISICOT_02950 [Neisseria sicca ATCC 29256]